MKAVNWNTQEDMTNMFWRQNISQMWWKQNLKVYMKGINLSRSLEDGLH